MSLLEVAPITAVSITILKHNVPWGPFTRPQIDAGLQRGDFTVSYLAHAPGLKDWLPLGEVLDYVDRGLTLPPLPTARDLPGLPGRPPVPVDPAQPIERIVVKPPALPPPVVLASPSINPIVPVPPPPAPHKLLRTAPFLLRGVAFCIDTVVLFAPIVVIFGVGGIVLYAHGLWDKTDRESMNQSLALVQRNFFQTAGMIAFVLAWLYAAILESSRWQGTIGKQWMGMKVSDWDGERIGFLRASCRHFAKYVTALTFGIGILMALFSSRRLMLHDHLAVTRVIR